MPSAYIVKWVTKSNHPANIVNNAELQNITTARRPHTIIPFVSTISRDITASFAKCCEKIGKMLKVSANCQVTSLSRVTNYKDYSKHLHFATNA